MEGRNDIEYIRRRIAREYLLSERAASMSVALVHRKLARFYELEIEMEAARLVDEAVVRDLSMVDPEMAAALRDLD